MPSDASGAPAVMDAVTHVPAPANETALDYAPGSAERAELEVALADLGSQRLELPHTIAGKRVMGGGKKIDVRQPHARRKVLGTMRNATVDDAAARRRPRPRTPRPAGARCRSTTAPRSCSRRPSCCPGRGGQKLNAATMLGQSKTALPGRDRLRLRADRLLADQRPLRPADPRASSRR